MKEEWRNAQHMARPVQSVPSKTTSVLSAYKRFHLRHQEKYSPRETCRKASLRYTKICNPHLRMNVGSCHSLNRSMLSAATRAECMQPWKSGTKLLKSRWTLEYPAMSRSYLPADAEILKTMRKLITYSKSELRVLGTVIAPVRNPRNNVEYTEEFVVVVDVFAPLLGAEACIK